jgi:hypothetical protein
VRTCFPQAFLNCELVAASWSELRGVLALLVVSALPVDGSRKPMETMPRLVVFFFARSLLTENPLGSACWEGGFTVLVLNYGVLWVAGGGFGENSASVRRELRLARLNSFAWVRESLDVFLWLETGFDFKLDSVGYAMVIVLCRNGIAFSI